MKGGNMYDISSHLPPPPSQDEGPLGPTVSPKAIDEILAEQTKRARRHARRAQVGAWAVLVAAVLAAGFWFVDRYSPGRDSPGKDVSTVVPTSPALVESSIEAPSVPTSYSPEELDEVRPIAEKYATRAAEIYATYPMPRAGREIKKLAQEFSDRFDGDCNVVFARQFSEVSAGGYIRNLALFGVPVNFAIIQGARIESPKVLLEIEDIIESATDLNVTVEGGKLWTAMVGYCAHPAEESDV